MKLSMLLGACLLLAACVSTPEDRCTTARIVVTAYDAANAAGERVPSKEEAIGAAIARALLAARCAP
jgi:starvation-inducible outer membrane lipoprotein